MGSLRGLAELMQKTGITRAVALAPFMHCMPNDAWYQNPLPDEAACNEWLCNMLPEYPGIVGFVTVNPKNPDAEKIIERYAGRGFKGIKIHPPVFQVGLDEPVMARLCAQAEAIGLPLLIHTSSHGWHPERYRPSLIGLLAEKYRRLKIIVEHMGGRNYFEEALAVVERCENCYAGLTSTLHAVTEAGRPDVAKPVENSSYLSAEKICELIAKLGARRIIYGADYPFNGAGAVAQDLERIQDWPISEEEKKYILGQTLEELLDVHE